MTPTERIAATLLKVIGWVVALGSGAFMLLYLYRWEWNRAFVLAVSSSWRPSWRWSPRRDPATAAPDRAAPRRPR